MVIGSCVYPHNNVKDLTINEALTCLETVQFVTDLGFKKAYIERDALTVIKKLKTEEADRSKTCKIVDEIRNQRKRFSNLSFHFVRRSVNKVAHHLAIWGRRSILQGSGLKRLR